MSLARKYINSSVLDEEVRQLVNLFLKLISTPQNAYKCLTDKEVEMCDYFCELRFCKKLGNNTYSVLPESSLINAFILFSKALTNSISIPCMDYLIGFKPKDEVEILENRLALSVGLFHGEHYTLSCEKSYLICAFKGEPDYELQVLPERLPSESLKENLLLALNLQGDTPQKFGKVVYFVWNRQDRNFVFNSVEDKEYFEEHAKVYEKMPKVVKDLSSMNSEDNFGISDDTIINKMGEMVNSFSKMFKDSGVVVNGAIITPDGKVIKLGEEVEHAPENKEHVVEYKSVMDDARGGISILKDGKEVYFLFKKDGDTIETLSIMAGKIIEVMKEADER